MLVIHKLIFINLCNSFQTQNLSILKLIIKIKIAHLIILLSQYNFNILMKKLNKNNLFNAS